MSSLPTVEDWIPWNGGECPVAAGVLHYRRYRDGAEVGVCRQATGVNPRVWQHFGNENDIIAYRILSPGGAK